MQPGSPFLGDVAEGALGATEISGGRGGRSGRRGWSLGQAPQVKGRFGKDRFIEEAANPGEKLPILWDSYPKEQILYHQSWSKNF